MIGIDSMVNLSDLRSFPVGHNIFKSIPDRKSLIFLTSGFVFKIDLHESDYLMLFLLM